MPVKLVVNKIGDTDYYTEHEYAQEIIQIGRDASNTLTLEDKSKTVSRFHAIIKKSDGQYCLFDCESRNATYLNDKKASPNDPMPLSNGDAVRMGEFVVIFSETEDALTDEVSDQTLMYHNPFKDEMESLRTVIQQIQIKFHEEPDPSRQETLRIAFQEAFMGIETGEVGDIIATEVGTPAAPAGTADPAPAAAPPSASATSQSHLDRVLNTLMDAVIKVSHAAYKFRREFIGITMIKSEDSLFGLTTDQLKSHLLEAGLSDKQAIKRLSSIQAQVEEVLLHQKALEAGYRAAIEDGPERLLQSLNPDNLKKHFMHEKVGIWPIKIPIRYIPFLLKLKVYRASKEVVNELLSEGRVAQDRHVIRPAFINAYMERMAISADDLSSDSSQF